MYRERRFDIACVVDAVDGRAFRLNVLTASNAIGNACRPEAESHTAAGQPVQHLGPCEQQREYDAGGSNEEDVERNAHIGCK